MLLGRRQGRQQQRRQNGDGGDRRQQFDQREAARRGVETAFQAVFSCQPNLARIRPNRQPQIQSKTQCAEPVNRLAAS